MENGQHDYGWVSLNEARGLPRPAGLETIIYLKPSEQWIAPAPVSVFGETEGNYQQVAAAFRTSRRCTSVPVYIAIMNNVLVSPRGIVFSEDGRPVYESVFPWQIENAVDAFRSELLVNEGRIHARELPDAVQRMPKLIHAREGGETGYFHFINSILPRVAVLKRIEFGSDVPLTISTHSKFASELLGQLNVVDTAGPPAWRRVDRLYYLSPFTFQGDHFTRPPFGSVLLRELLSRHDQTRGTRKIYLSRGDVTVRRLVNEAALLNILTAAGFETVTIGDMSMAEQISLFSQAKVLISAHGAGLSNMIFMPEGSTVVEMVSPSRLWPTFRMLAARHNRWYHAVIGNTVELGQTADKAEGNEDFGCDPAMLRLALKEVDLRG